MRILHITVTRELTTGQLTQLRHETRAAQDLEEVQWDTIAYQTMESQDDFVYRLPWFFRPIFLRNLFAWLWLIRHAREYDYIISRHMTFDPFAFIFARCISNRVTIHHAKEVEELKLIRSNGKGRAASLLERWSGCTAVRNAKAVLGVTGEIRDYELEFHAAGKDIPASVYPNGIRVEDVEVLQDQRPEKHLEIAFMCGTFSAWHGLDILLDQFEDPEAIAKLDLPVRVHLIGRLSLGQKEQVERIQAKSEIHRIEVHGLLTPEVYRTVLARCQIGLDSLAIDRKGLTEAATLKVREMLASGLPVYSGHKDTALSDEFPWYVHGKGELVEIYNFALSVSNVSRQEVRESARPWIEKRKWMDAVAGFLADLKGRHL